MLKLKDFPPTSDFKQAKQVAFALTRGPVPLRNSKRCAATAEMGWRLHCSEAGSDAPPCCRSWLGTTTTSCSCSTGEAALLGSAASLP